ncbi:hypothetical protein [Glycomyces buryatensis]|uniref:Uncharacterized protein n=1 Tax=Glycomyces buryatensis TaxID=2570927 RepID=A0A4S8QDY7_9ACTN|nr:hypothetical protein [Glycomyces buryatensis]THV41312.1 hypothetical protein FAB82_12160 [Glycomyces buryatensis]
MVLHRTRYYPLAVQILAGICMVIAAIIALFLVLILLNANQSNPLVTFVGNIADWFAWLFHDMFSADNARIQALINYGLAALVYLGLAGLIHALGRRTVD